MIIYKHSVVEIFYIYNDEELPAILRRKGKILTKEEFIKKVDGKRKWAISIAEFGYPKILLRFVDIRIEIDIKDLLKILEDTELLHQGEAGLGILYEEARHNWGAYFHIKKDKTEEFIKRFYFNDCL